VKAMMVKPTAAASSHLGMPDFHMHFSPVQPLVRNDGPCLTALNGRKTIGTRRRLHARE
jgi:hypothetical protein